MIEGLAAVMIGVVTQYPNAEHPAWDIACRVGRPVHAYNAGTLKSYYHSGLGIVVTIEGPEGRSLYAHLNARARALGPVEKGDLIGYCGNSGTWTTGPHLHFEYKPL